MSKYLLHPNHINDQIITKAEDGADILITKEIFNDYFGELLLKNNLHHLIIINQSFDTSSAEKKTFHQVTEDVILLTSTPEQIAERAQNQTVEPLKLKRKPGPQPKAKA